MSKVFVTDTYLTDIGNAIREKNGETTTYKPSEMAAAIQAISGGGEQPKLNAPTIKITVDTLTITANKNNGNFVTGYNVYVNPGTGYVLFGTTTTLTNDLTQYQVPLGDYSIKVTAVGENFIESDYSNELNYTNIFYTITNTLTNCTSNNSQTSIRKGSAYSATITADSGYQMAGANVRITMGGADITSAAYSDKTITISSVTDNVIISISAAKIAGAQWQLATSPDNNNYAYLSVASDAIYANTIGYSSSVCAKSTDGVNWEPVQITVPIDAEINNNSNNKSRLIFGDNGYIFCPVDVWYCFYSTGSLTSWTRVDTKIRYSNHKLCFAAYGNGRIVLGYNTTSPSTFPAKTSVSSDNGKTWTMKELPFGITDLSGAFLNGLFYVFTDSNKKFYTSADGLTWEEHSCDVVIPTVNPENNFQVDYAVYAQNKYIIKLDGASCIYSENGIDWVKVGTGKYLSQIAYFNGKFYGENCVSEDGINWTAFESETNVATLSVFNNKLVGLDKSAPKKFYYATE